MARYLPPPHSRRGAIRAWLVLLLVTSALVVAGPPAAPAVPRAAAAANAEADAANGSAHEASEGLSLVAQAPPDPVSTRSACPKDAPERRYDVVAINVDITLNRYLDHDPEGRMYVLAQDLGRVREEEKANARARAEGTEPAVSIGLQGDAIQPLLLRVNQGECLRIHLTNELKSEAAGIHLHAAPLMVSGTGRPAIATNPESVVLPGRDVSYEWMVDKDEPEGTHYFHSHGDDRQQTAHGLFGALVVEPAGSRHLAPSGTGEIDSGWDAVIAPPTGSAFREFALFYHEIGDETYQLLDKAGNFVPQVDPFMQAYRPDGRALNYRSEPFMNRLALEQTTTGQVDESVAYSSYAFGDPATPIMRSYLGDPVKQRVIHGGSEVAHVHHVHGGAIRWRRQPKVEPSNFDTGLDKHPPLIPAESERTDSQSLGPSETFDVENECGSGGCQQSVGDYLYHCHVAHHYIAGMWGLWRVYNTKQDGAASTDALVPLDELPGRTDRVKAAVTSDKLTAAQAAAIERQLPPQGQPRGYDASVLDWGKDGAVYLNEQETAQAWPGYRPSAPGTRPALTFDPVTGKPAYPWLLPHLGKRPPFAPNHGPAPYLEPQASGTEPAAPGSNGPDSLCPSGTTVKQFSIRAVNVPIVLNQKANLVDPNGELFVLDQQEAAVKADNNLRVPLAIRANATEDCVDVLLVSELPDSVDNHNLSKVNLHVHFVQFDVQGSDGVIAGYNYETSVRPFAEVGDALATDAPAGATAIRLASTDRYQPGAVVGIGLDKPGAFESARVVAVDGDELVIDHPLARDHGQGEYASTEFVRYRWYPDAQLGTAYFHDHVNALNSWRHGLFGALIVEPPGSTYHDPHTGAVLDSGPIADIHTSGRVSADVEGSFREFALFVQDENPLTRLRGSSGSSFNLRVEPLAARGPDTSQLFSSVAHGDPETPLPEAFVGDPVVIRTLVGGTNDVHTVHVDGHWFRIEPWSLRSPPVNTVRVGISERYDVSIPAAGGPQRKAGDYLYYSGRILKIEEGSWGILRVRDAAGPGQLRPLPGRATPAPAPAGAVCPSDSPKKSFSVTALETPLPMLDGPGKVYVLDADVAAVKAGTKAPQPLVLHVDVGDCIVVTLTNATSGPVSFHTDLLASDPATSSGVAAGFDPVAAVAPGERGTTTHYASPEVGPTTALVRDWGDVTTNPGLGLFGAVVVAPQGATFGHNGDDQQGSAAVDVTLPDGTAYHDFSLFLQDDDATLGTHKMPYGSKVDGVVGLNYGTAPLADRLDRDPSRANAVRTDIHGDPATAVLEADAGDAVHIHVLVPWSEQAQVFSVEGHRWPVEPGLAGTPLVGSTLIGGLEATTLELDGGAGGTALLAGDYVVGDHRGAYFEAGMWGILRVRPNRALALRTLGCVGGPEAGCPRESRVLVFLRLAAGASVFVAMASFGFVALRPRGAWGRSRRGRPRADTT